MICNVNSPALGSSRDATLFQQRFDPSKTSGENAIAHEVEEFRERLIDRALELAESDNSALIRADHVEMAAMDLLDLDLSQADDTDHFHRLVDNWNMAPENARKQFVDLVNWHESNNDD
jgi:hypothetical protein